MNEKLKQFLNSQIPITVLSIALGVGLIFLPAGTMGILCRVLFGVVFMLTGGYHIFRQVMERPGTEESMPDLYTGVVVLVLGLFLFSNPAVVLMLLPWMLGAFIIADSIWMIKAGIKMQKANVGFWKVMMIASAACIVMALVLALYHFEQVRTMLTYAGWLFFLNGAADIVLTQMARRQMLAAEEAGQIPPDGETDLPGDLQEDAVVPAGEESAPSEGEAGSSSESGAAAPSEFGAAAPSEFETAAPSEFGAAAPSESGAAAPSEDETAAASEPGTAAPSFEEPSATPDVQPAEPAPLADTRGEAAQESLPKPMPAPWEKASVEPDPEEEPVKMEEDAKAPWESSADPFKMQ